MRRGNLLPTAPCSLPQVELHPYNQQPKLVRFAAQHGIAVTGFSPLGAATSARPLPRPAPPRPAPPRPSTPPLRIPRAPFFVTSARGDPLPPPSPGAGSYVELGMAGEQDSALRDPVIQSIAERLGNRRPRPPPPSPSPLSPPPPALLTAERPESLGAPVGVSAAQVVLRWAVQRGYSVETRRDLPRLAEIRRDLPRFATAAILPPSEERRAWRLLRLAGRPEVVAPGATRAEPRLVRHRTPAPPRRRRVQRSSGCCPSPLLGFELAPDDLAAIATLDRGKRFNDPGVFSEGMNAFLPIYD